MYKNLYLLLLHLLLCQLSLAADPDMSTFKSDSLALEETRLIAWNYLNTGHDSAIFYLDKMKAQAEDLSSDFHICKYYDYKGYYLMDIGDIEEAIESSLKAQDIAVAMGDYKLQTGVMFNLAAGISSLGCEDRALPIYKECNLRFHNADQIRGEEVSISNVAHAYLNLDMLDSAKVWADKLKAFQDEHDFANFNVEGVYAHYYAKTGEYEKAVEHMLVALKSYDNTFEGSPLADMSDLAIWYIKLDQPEKAEELLEEMNGLPDYHQRQQDGTLYGVKIELAKYRGDEAVAIDYLTKKRGMLDSLVATIDFAAIERALNLMEKSSTSDRVSAKQVQIMEAQTQHRDQTKLFWFLALPCLLLLIAFFIFQFIVSEKNKKLQLAVEELKEQDRHIADSISYGRKIQQALFTSSTQGIGNARLFMDEYAEKSSLESNLCWTQQHQEQYLTCFYHPCADEVSDAFSAIICNAAFEKISKKMSALDWKRLDIRLVHEELMEAMEKKLFGKAKALAITLMHCDNDSNKIALFDGEQINISSTDLEDAMELKHIAVQIASGEVSVFCEETARLLQDHQGELIEDMEKSVNGEAETLSDRFKNKGRQNRNKGNQSLRLAMKLHFQENKS